MTKIIALPNITIGDTIVNYIVDYYMQTVVCTNPGIKSRTGWHVQPTYRKRYERKPYCSAVLTPEQLTKYESNTEYLVEIIR